VTGAGLGGANLGLVLGGVMRGMSIVALHGPAVVLGGDWCWCW
jgi:hypothetical protein